MGGGRWCGPDRSSPWSVRQVARLGALGSAEQARATEYSGTGSQGLTDAEVQTPYKPWTERPATASPGRRGLGEACEPLRVPLPAWWSKDNVPPFKSHRARLGPALPGVGFPSMACDFRIVASLPKGTDGSTGSFSGTLAVLWGPCVS